MKSQLKALISDNITAIEYDRDMIVRNITHFYDNCDKADSSDSSVWNFQHLNGWKNEKRRVDAKLKKLRALQVEVKKLFAYTTKKSSWAYVNGKPQIVDIITTKEV